MSAELNFGLEQERRRTASRLRDAEVAAGRARDLSEVVRLSRVTVPSWMLSLVRPERTALRDAAERRAEALLDEDILSLADLDGPKRHKKLAQLRQRWLVLSGNFPRLAVKAGRVR